MQYFKVIMPLLTLAIHGCVGSTNQHGEITEPYSSTLQTTVTEEAFKTLLQEHDLLTLGAAVITNGEIEWTGQFGDQAPGIPASDDTQFNVGSITKTVAAETILRLVEAGEFSFDTPMAPIWIDPDIKDDPRHKKLTPRIALTHTTGFPNWRFFTEDRKLKFLTDPGTTFTYSGEGFEYLATFAEKHTGKKFQDLVKSYVFDPMNISNASYSIDEDNFPHIVQTKDRDGSFPGHYCYPENGYCRVVGSSTPADDLVITVKDFAAFLISVMNAEGYSDAIAQDRNRVQSVKEPSAATVLCEDEGVICPVAQGYGLGWEVLEFDDRKIIAHGGSDWHELAIAYFDTQSKNGVIIFINAPSIKALNAMPEALAIVDPDSPMIGLYKRWLRAAETQ